MSDVKKIMVDALAVTRKAGKQLGDGISGIREHIRTLKRERTEIRRLPISLDQALGRVDSWISVQMQSALSLYPRPQRFSDPDYRAPATPMEVLLYVQLGPKMAESLKADVEKLYQQNPGISEQERAMRIVEIDRKILDAELAEESMIRAAEASGFPVLRRRDADPRAVLAHDKVLP